VVMVLAQPCRFIAFLINFGAAALSRSLVTKGFQHLALMIDGSPEVAHFTVDADIDLIQAPALMGVLAHRPDPLLTDLRGERRTKAGPLQPHCLMADGTRPVSTAAQS